MKPIEGIDLANEFKLAEEAVLEQQRQQVQMILSGVATEAASFKQERRDCEQRIEEIDERLKEINERCEKIKAGDWSELRDMRTPTSFVR